MSTVMTVPSLWEEYTATRDPELRQRLILQYAPLAKYVIGRMAIGLPGVLDSEDIISHATLGLIDAVERFDPHRGLKFETYAIPRIRGSVLDAVRQLGIHRRGSRRRMKEIEDAIGALEEDRGRAPTDEEVAEFLGISLEEYRRQVLDDCLTVVPLDQVLRASEDDEFLTFSDVIADDQASNFVEEVEHAEFRSALAQAIDALPERHRLVIALYYYEGLTLKEISRILEVSESRVCQLHGRAILELRKVLNARYSEDIADVKRGRVESERPWGARALQRAP